MKTNLDSQDSKGFNNPILLDDFNLNFSFIDSESEGKQDNDSSSAEELERKFAIDDIETIETIENVSNVDLKDLSDDKKDKKDNKDNKDSSSSNTNNTNNSNKQVFDEESDTSDSELYRKLASELVDEDLLEEAPEGFDPEKEMTFEDYQELLKFNLKHYKEQANQLREVFDGLSETATSLIEYEANGGQDTKGFIESLMYQEEITTLNPNNDRDAEKIVFEWYKSQGLESDKIRSKITKLKDRGDLIDEATELKPELDKKAMSIAQAKQEDQAKKAQFEKQIKTAYVNRVQDTLKTGKLDGVKVPRELSTYLTSVLTTDNVPVRLPNSTEVNVSYMEYLIKKHSYSKEGSIERLALAALLLERPDDFKKLYMRDVETKETERFVREHKLSNLKKAGRVSDTPNTKQSTDSSALFRLIR